MLECFSYLDFIIEGAKVSFKFEIEHGEEKFNLIEVLEFPVAFPDTLEHLTRHLLEQLHLGLGISYYKIFASNTIKHPYQLTKQGAEFWNIVFRKGLAEFCYQNKLAIENLASFAPNSSKTVKCKLSTTNSALLGIGGGKDSIVALELLRKINLKTTGFLLEPSIEDPHARAVAETAELPLMVIKRSLDPLVKSLNERSDSYNGHIPISMIFAFCGLVLASLTKTKYVVVGNEAASSIPSIKYNGVEVNHQWSKSLEFEKLLQNYLASDITKDITYFSAIRPLSSIAVVTLLAKLPPYLAVFTSCNQVMRIDSDLRPNGRWCLECPKCLSTFILLAAWVSEDALLEIFGKNLLNEQKLAELFLALIGFSGQRPLDCVGTIDELRLSLNIAVMRHRFDSSQLMELAIKHNIISINTELNEVLELSESSFPKELENKLIVVTKESLKK